MAETESTLTLAENINVVLPTAYACGAAPDRVNSSALAYHKKCKFPVKKSFSKLGRKKFEKTLKDFLSFLIVFEPIALQKRQYCKTRGRVKR